MSVKLAAVITADLRLNEPRYASLPSIIKARKKPIEFITAEELGVTLEPRVELVHLEIASSQRTCVRVKDVAELVHRLRHEAIDGESKGGGSSLIGGASSSLADAEALLGLAADV